MQWIAAILLIPYLIFFTRIWMGLQKLKKYVPGTSQSVPFSVIIPCKNEAANIKFLLSDISCQKYPDNLFEVIIVDDNSEDSTYETVSSFNGIKNLSVVKNHGSGKKAAIKNGITIAKNKYIITTDADCRVSPDWFAVISDFIAKNSPDMVICPVRIENRQGFFFRFQELEFLSLQGVTAGCAALDSPTMCNGANLCFQKEAYLKNADNLHPEIGSGDDIFLLHSLKKQKDSKILWLESPDALAVTSPSLNLADYIIQRKRWLSKGKAYEDRDTINLAIVTFVTNALTITLFGLGIFNHLFFPVFLFVFFLRAVPDFLILYNRAKCYGRKYLLWWFIPCELLYPVYVMAVSLISFIGIESNSPFRKGI